MSTVAHIWNEFQPGQLPDPRHHLPDRKDWVFHVLAATGIDLENPVPDMPEVSAFTRRSRARWRHASLVERIVRRATQPLFWRCFENYALKRFKELDPHILHFHFGHTAGRSLRMIQRSGLRSVVSFYGVDASALVRDPRWQRSYRRLFGLVDRVVVLSELVGRRLEEAGCPPEKLRVWNFWAGVEPYTYRERRPGPQTRFIMAARFVEKKGQRYLLEAMCRVLATRRDATLTVLGYGSERQVRTLEEMVRSLGLSGSVDIVNTNASNDFTQVYRAQLEQHDICVQPSTTAANGDDEAGPAQTMLYAQSAGLPVISTPFVGSETQIIDNVTGLYCRQDDPESLMERMIYLMDTPQLWNRLGKAGSDFVRREFSMKGQMAKLLAIYEELL